MNCVVVKHTSHGYHGRETEVGMAEQDSGAEQKKRDQSPGEELSDEELERAAGGRQTFQDTLASKPVQGGGSSPTGPSGSG
jgi:hypothetical protein